MSNSPSQRREVLYSGRVQGVGFRYTVNRLAREHEVTGFVRNLPDGRVHLVVEGLTEEADGFLENVARTMSGYIRDTAVEEVAATGEFGEFAIRF